MKSISSYKINSLQLRSIKDFFSFFTSKFYDNIKFNHSFSSKLKVMFERSTKTRQTLSSLGNVYRNSKWTDLSIQNIKSSHSSSFVITSSFYSCLCILFIFIAFRLQPSCLNSILSEIAHVGAITLDFIRYCWTSGLIYAASIAKCISLKIDSLTSKQISKIKLIADPSKLRNFKIKRFGAPVLLTKSGRKVNSSKEAILIKYGLLLKQMITLKWNEYTSPAKTTKMTEEDIIAYFAKKSIRQKPAKLSKMLHEQEINYALSVHYKPKFTKPHLTNLNTSSKSSNLFSDLAVNASIASSLSVSNESRWLLKMSPLSENLTLNNNYTTNLKYSLGSSVTNSKVANDNIWVSNLENSVELGALNNNLSFLHTFEDSRLWSQKRMYFTLLPNIGLTLQKGQVLTNLEKPMGYQGHGVALSALNLDYLTLKNGLLTSSSINDIFNNTDLQGVWAVHNSNIPLNLWGSLDNEYILALCNTNSLKGELNYYTYVTSSGYYSKL